MWRRLPCLIESKYFFVILAYSLPRILSGPQWSQCFSLVGIFTLLLCSWNFKSLATAIHRMRMAVKKLFVTKETSQVVARPHAFCVWLFKMSMICLLHKNLQGVLKHRVISCLKFVSAEMGGGSILAEFPTFSRLLILPKLLPWVPQSPGTTFGGH